MKGMKPHSMAVLVTTSALLVLLVVAPAGAEAPGAAPAFTPQVPVSAFGMARNWLDPSRLHVSSMMSVGSGWGSGGASALQVTTLSYSFKAPVRMSVSVGNAWGSTATRNGQSFFLEGFSLAYRPNRTFQFQIQYQDLRSPLQLQYGYRGMGPTGYWP